MDFIEEIHKEVTYTILDVVLMHSHLYYLVGYVSISIS